MAQKKRLRQNASVPEVQPIGPEIVVGLVGAVGTDLKSVTTDLTEALRVTNYATVTIRLAFLLDEFDRWGPLPRAPEEDRLAKYMDAGDELRGLTADGGALAILSIGDIRKTRRKRSGGNTRPASGTCYVLRSLKHPDEVRALRRIYGPSFILISAYSPRSIRRDALARRIAASHHAGASERFQPEAETLIHRDEADITKKWGQDVRDTFPMADVFIDTRSPNRMQDEIRRVVNLYFGHPFLTPTPDEYSMFHAKAASLRSAALGRQVGCAIATPSGDLVSVGTNEVPKAGGGLYWANDPDDRRDHVVGFDSSEQGKRNVLAEILNRLHEKGWLAEDKGRPEINKLIDDAMGPDPNATLRGSRVTSLTEFGRIVHAEMAAIVDAARRGASVRGCSLYTTTFPCHDCAKHIVASGITRVVYVEPYPKSLAFDLFPDSISIDEPTTVAGKVSFEPFVGVAPSRYLEWFTAPNRKDDLGGVLRWSAPTARPRYSRSASVYIDIESFELKRMREKIVAAGLVKNTNRVKGRSRGDH